ncbi:HvfC/BufC N-terminal domain-containing protein [Curvivirga aplysinae]|uniref:HvfC/BufC N-terminal domain-containing protein n=1 Tax=Curvivirga aplysinae TaxID=2529852 RepID=UPI0012BC85CA|nr:DNA-binding domain-containing protein [Curvivirga aplysinae]MTI08764.1 DUF2063 domain-containing protein [Curvivirga aplysinae]
MNMELCQMLHEFQSGFKTAILENQPTSMSEFLQDESHLARMSIYRNNIFVSLMNVLIAAFPKTSTLVGADNFQVLAKKFVEKRPPDEAQLSEYGSKFPDFLTSWEQVVADIPYLPDLARLDWGCQEAYFAQNYDPIDPSLFAQMSPEDLFDTKLDISPSVRLLKSDYPVTHFYEMDDFGIEQLSPETEYIMVNRLGETEQIMTDRLSEADYHFLEKLKAGFSLGDTFLDIVEEDPLFDLQASLTQFLHKSVFMKLGDK